MIIVGRTESNLQETAKHLGHNTAYYVLDTGNVSSIPAFVAKVTKEHPEVDCIVNNAGVQRPLDIYNFPLEDADQEIDINIRGPMHLAVGFLPHLKSKQSGGIIVNVTSVLGYVPISVETPVYNGTKAWLHSFTLNLRSQLRKANANVRVVEIAPPLVETDLHRHHDDPDNNKKAKNPRSLSMEEFMASVTKGFEDDQDTISAGPGGKIVERWHATFGEDYAKMTSAA